MSILLVSALFGDNDEVQPLPALPDGMFARMYTDQRGAAGWPLVVNPTAPRADLPPRLRAQYFKHQIHRGGHAENYRWLAWADASLRFKELGFIRSWAARLEALEAQERALFVPHPQRKTIAEETNFICEQLAAGNRYVADRYTAEATHAQMAWLGAHGIDTNAPLYCGGFWIVENSPLFRRVFNDWWDQTLRFGAIDQLALGALLAAECSPQRLEVDIANNPHFCHVAHKR